MKAEMQQLSSDRLWEKVLIHFQPILKVFCIIVVPPKVEYREDPGDEPGWMLIFTWHQVTKPHMERKLNQDGGYSEDRSRENL